MRWPIVSATIAAAILVAAVALTVASRGEGGPAGSRPLIERLADLPAIPLVHADCGAVLRASDAERRDLTRPLLAALGQAGGGVDSSIAAEVLAGACQTARPNRPARGALTRFAARRAPRAYLCRALQADRRVAMQAAAGALGSMRRTIAQLGDGQRPGLDRFYAAIRRSEGGSRRAASALRHLRPRTEAGRALRGDLRLFLADWARSSAVYRGASASPGALVRRVGAANAIGRLDRWLRRLSSLRERAEEIEALANTAPAGAPRSCILTRIALLE